MRIPFLIKISIISTTVSIVLSCHSTPGYVVKKSPYTYTHEESANDVIFKIKCNPLTPQTNRCPELLEKKNIRYIKISTDEARTVLWQVAFHDRWSTNEFKYGKVPPGLNVSVKVPAKKLVSGKKYAVMIEDYYPYENDWYYFTKK